MINVNANVSSVPKAGVLPAAKGAGQTNGAKTDFAKFVRKYVSEVDNMQQDSDTAVKQLLSGRNQDITSVVAAVAKADMSFKLLVSVRNKIIEAYKKTMNMGI